MEEIFELIFGNLFALFVVIGFIMKAFSKGEAKKSGGKTSTSPKQKQQKQKLPEFDWMDIFQLDDEEELPPVKKQEQPLQKPNYELPDPVIQEPVLAEAKASESSATTSIFKQHNNIFQTDIFTSEKIDGQNTNTAESPIYKDDITASGKTGLNLTNLRSEDYIKGIVLAEVLGKPRAKNSYRFKARQNA